MKMSLFARFRSVGWVLIVLLLVAGRASHASPITQGTYTGIYSGDDYGTVTIAIDAQGNVTCDFLSTPKFLHYRSSGTENPTSYLISCNSASSASYYWSAASNPSSIPTNSIVGYWGGNVNGTQISGNFTANYSSVSVDPAGSLNTASYAGLWYQPQYTGTGFNVLPSSAGLLVTYFGVDANGKLLWLVSDTGPKTITIGTQITLNMSYSSSGTFQAPVRTPVPWGTLSLTFTSCSKATATLNGKDGNLTESLVMLTGAAGMPGCD